MKQTTRLQLNQQMLAIDRSETNIQKPFTCVHTCIYLHRAHGTHNKYTQFAPQRKRSDCGGINATLNATKYLIKDIIVGDDVA